MFNWNNSYKINIGSKSPNSTSIVAEFKNKQLVWGQNKPPVVLLLPDW